MFSIKIGTDFLPIPEGQSLKWVKNSELFSTDIPDGEYSYPINLSVHQKIVNKYLGNLSRLQSDKNTKTLDVSIYFNNIPIENNARLVIRKYENGMVQGYFLTGSSMLAKALRETPLNSVDFGSIYIGDTHQDIVDHMKDTLVNPNQHFHVFAPVYAPNFKANFSVGTNIYGRFINQYSTGGEVFLQNENFTMMNLNAYVPFPKLYHVLSECIKHFGFTLDWPLLNDAVFRKIVLVNNVELSESIIPLGFQASSATTQTIAAKLFDMTNAEFLDSGWVAKQKPIPGSDRFLNFTDTTTAPNFNHLDLFDLLPNGYTITQTNVKHYIDFEITFEPNSNNAVLNNNRLTFEVWLGNEFLTSYQSEILAANNNSKTIIARLEFDAPDGSFGKLMRFKAGIINLHLPNFNPITGVGEAYSLLATHITALQVKLSYLDAVPIQTLKDTIMYNQHLSDVSCSEFLNSIRKRFGAFVSNIDFENKVISFRQLDNVSKSVTNKPLFQKRDKEFKLELTFNRYLFTEDFGDDDFAQNEMYVQNLAQLSVGSDDVEAEENTVELLFGPVFNHTFETNFGNILYAAVGFTGKSADNEGAQMRLAMFHGLQPEHSNSIANKLPFISSQNINSKNQVIAPWHVSLGSGENVWVKFLKAWYQKLFKMEVYEFDVWPTINEVRQFAYDKVDFYQFCLFCCRKAEFNLRRNKIEKCKVEMVKL